MKCLHCRTAFNFDNARADEYDLGRDDERFWGIVWVKCPDCERFNITLFSAPPRTDGVSAQPNSSGPPWDTEQATYLPVHPLGATRPLSSDVPSPYADRFQQATRVVPMSPEASAALSRRLLQDLIREVAKIERRNLNDEIEALLDSNALPSGLANDVDAIRQVGNFAAHPIKSQSSGEIVAVEPGEADWLLDVLEELFDFYFVRPKSSERRRERLNEKLEDAGKPPLKARAA